MKYKELIIEKKEFELLKQIISMSQHYKDKSYRLSIQKLLKEMNLAKVVSSAKMPLDVIRLNSEVTISTPDNVQSTYHLVMPELRDMKRNKISILAPMGLALFGYAKGDEIEWEFPKGSNKIKILDVIQHPQILKKTAS
ncbi:GreA/GreB family elongation factor [Salinimicrobium sediminilitoris]|uniref:GreA/GreB family elongation factor n=1 Tax=Salinimicrobium sediminilitoris TaxID=2876715 RepID=UPI001E282ED0|nr:GreA/GreB family elongation factor [Salinimicrobium sediminilitoris]MCC8360424.1 GreA/GreB family elongation factor [Salinimicrobium sediminilitoris]